MSAVFGHMTPLHWALDGAYFPLLVLMMAASARGWQRVIAASAASQFVIAVIAGAGGLRFLCVDATLVGLAGLGMWRGSRKRRQA